VSALSKQTDQKTATAAADDAPPGTAKPAPQAIDQYVVAADLPRYLLIPKTGVKARVLQIGVDTSGHLAAPDNIHDAAWYTGSAKPGQSGATVLDGHVASLNAPGVFHDVKQLRSGDTLQIVRGDNQVLTYLVVKSQIYASGAVDMLQALAPITPGKPGLNLITCAGKVKPGTHQFDSRLIVFAEQL
jgi:LPXTG-site transpeptidase (sortase) family protein